MTTTLTDLALVRCDAVSRTFGSGSRAVVAVHAVSCRVPDGARIAVVGPSGSGKSTLLHLMGGLETPTSGTVEWPLLGTTLHQTSDLVGTVFQGASLIPALTALENVALPLVFQGLPDAAAKARAADTLKLLNIQELAAKLPEELSGGQAQRVAVARVVATRPRLILADEPTGQLDRAAAARVVDVLVKVADEIGAGLVISTHDPHIASRMRSQWRMHEGSLSAISAAASRDGQP